MKTTKNKQGGFSKNKKNRNEPVTERKTPLPGTLGHKKENPKDGNIGKTNAGGYK